MDIHKQPQPFDTNWHRYCPQMPFPPYRHIPGVTPHPIRDPLGHSYGMEEELDDTPLPPEMWKQNEAYLYGVDLYNFAYWWEAHEAWEGLWHQAEDTYRLFLQGLIQVSASLIKYHMRMLRPLRTLSTAGRDKLRQVVVECGDANGDYMGINLPIFLDIADAFFTPFFSGFVTEETYQQIKVKPLLQLHF
ncbi:DUF309 domain-containing protein [Candidatus Poribacteria bacterium]|nr:DUF309 domain-containing protein [Candidatus Poribacteria bacterium]